MTKANKVKCFNEQCGKNLPDWTKYCPHCGTKQKDDEAAAQPQAQPQPQQDKEKKVATGVAEIVVVHVGENGEYNFSIQVLSNLGRGIKSRVKIIEGKNKQSTQETDENGFIDSFQAQPFNDAEREFLFFVIDSDKRKEIILSGPPRNNPVKKKEYVPGGFLANFFNAKDRNKR